MQSQVPRRHKKFPPHSWRFVVYGVVGVLTLHPFISAMAESFSGLTDPRSVTTSGQSAVALSDTIAPSSVANLASADSFNPALVPPCGPVSLYPMINTIGISITSPVSGTANASVRYRPTGTTTWTTGHEAVLTNTGRVDGSIFWLPSATNYDVEVTSRQSDGAALSVNHCTVTTLPELPVTTVTRTLYVSAAAPAGGNGSLSQPYATIQAAVSVSQPGDEIIVQPGVYYEGLTFPRSGQPGAYIKVVGQPGAIMDGSDPAVEQNGLTWTPDPTYPNVYSASIPTDFYADWYLSNDPIWRDTLHFYTYDTLADAQAGIAHGGGAMSEGWFFDTNTNVLTVRSLTDPDSHTWHIRSHDGAFRLTSRDYIWIEGLTMRYYPLAVYLPSGQHNVVRNNTIQAETGVLIDNSQARVAEANRIENNYLFDTPLADWGYDAVKGTRMETGALVSWQGTGNIFRDNRIEQHFNGIFTGDATETDVYRNVIRNLGDDGLELDGNAENVRVWGNAVDDVNSSLSVAPTTVGPVWVMYNRFTQFLGRAFKIGGGVSGIDFFYHNTVYTTTTGAGTQQVTNDSNRIVFRNNIFRSSDLAIRWTQAMPGVDMDYDNAYSPIAFPYYWNANYATLAEICSVEQQECHGSSAEPKLVDPANQVFSLRPDSPNIDSAVLIPGINHQYTGSGPDRGYLEYGQSDISW